MSLMPKEYRRVRREESRFYHQLVSLRPLSRTTLDWLEASGKHYGPETLTKFKIQQGTLQCFDRSAGSGSRGFVCSDRAVVMPAGTIYRCYRYERPKQDRWRVVPAGHGAQWLGNLSSVELLICEGEWDCLRLHDLGFEQAVTHTAGAGTWLDKWTSLFTGKKVWISYDRDRAGQFGAAKSAAKIFPVACEIRILDLPLPGTGDAKDVSDFFRLGGTKEDFAKLLRNARPYVGRLHRTGN
jgi:Toprim-like